MRRRGSDGRTKRRRAEKAQTSPRTKQRRGIVCLKNPRLWISLAGIICVGALLVWLTGSETAMGGIQSLFARITSLVLNLFGSGTVVQGNTVFSEAFGITVVTACTGLFATGLFLMAVIAFPTNWLSKLLGVGIGILGIFTVNIIRLASLYAVGIYWPAILDQVHQLVWQSLLIVFAVALWLIWASRAAAAQNGGRR